MSSGGNLAALVATDGNGRLDVGHRVRAAVSWSGPVDLAALAGSAVIENYIGCPLASCPDRYAAASAITFVDRSDPPMLLVNGSAELVPLDQANALARRLAAAHVPYRLLVIPGSRHAEEYADDAWRPTVAFLTRYLGRP